MCATYKPPEQREIEAQWEYIPPLFDFSWKPVIGPGGTAPFLSNFDRSLWLPGCFGIVPHWAELKLAKSTYNARSETVGTKPSYRHAWSQRQLCIIPAASFFEPCYETGFPVRWRIARADGKPVGIAGIWERRLKEEGDPARWSFSMLTVNAEAHALMRRFHRPEDEKRSVVVLEPEDFDGWLGASTEAEARSYLQLPADGVLVAEPDPLPNQKQRQLFG